MLVKRLLYLYLLIRSLLFEKLCEKRDENYERISIKGNLINRETIPFDCSKWCFLFVFKGDCSNVTF